MQKFRLFVPFIIILLIPLFFLSLPQSLIKDMKVHSARWLGPILSSVSQVKQNLGRNISQFWDLWRVREENRSLRNKITQLELNLMHHQEAAQENKRLLRLLNFSEREKYHSLPARVIGRDPNAWYRGIMIDRGRGQGVKVGMAVVVGEGLVGKVIEVFQDWSNVILLVDPRCKIGATVQKSRETGILQGYLSDQCVLKFLPREAHIFEGDRVVTAGLGRYMPKGLLIGKIERVEEHEYGLYKLAYVGPNVDVSHVEEVIVIDYQTERIKKGEQEI